MAGATGRAQTLRRSLASGHALSAGARLESTADTPTLPTRASIEARLDWLLARAPPAEARDTQAYRRALELVRRHAGPALAQLADPEAPLTPTAFGALEALVRADGSRPTLLICQGWIEEDHPFIGGWSDPLVAQRSRLRELVALCGRIQPSGGHAGLYAGTGTLVCADGPWVLTNFHVLAEARRSFPVAAVQTDRGIHIARGLEIDFLGEADGPDCNRWSIVEAVYPARAGEGFGFVDAVLLRLGQPLDGRPLPLPPGGTARALLSTAPAYLDGDAVPLVTIGFPAEPEIGTGVVDGIDWEWVSTALFGGSFGVKRLAPGLVSRRLGTAPDDAATRYAFGHDATTLRGASGSLLFALRDAGAPGFGLHFAGFDNDSNWAIAVPALVAAFAASGIRLA